MTTLGFAFCTIMLFTSLLNADVISIKTQKDFREQLKKSDSLVKFYAPWCGHCKALAPEYVTAAKELASMNEQVKLIEVDCTDSKLKNTCDKYKVRGYPTLKFFKHGVKDPLDYEGARQSKDIINYVIKITGDSIQHIDSQEKLDQLVKQHEVVVVEYAKDKENSQVFRQLADKLRLEYFFASISDEKLMDGHSMKFNDIAMFKTFDDKKVHFKDTEMKLSEWIEHHSIPVLGEMGQENYAKYMKKNMPVFWIAVDKSKKDVIDGMKKLEPVFKKYKEKILAIYIDAVKYKSPLKDFGFEEELPSAMIIQQDKKYKHTKSLNAEEVEKFINDFLDGKAKVFFRSGKKPEKNEGPIFEVVADTFDEIVKDEEHDVLLEFYLSGCKKCKEFEKEYKKLSKLLESHKEVRLARLNADENDTHHKADNFPSLVLFPAGKKESPVVYSGDMTASKIEDWLLNNSPKMKKNTKEKEEL